MADEKELEAKYFAKVFEQDVQVQMGHDVGNIWTHLVGEQQQGKEWVAYPDVEKVSKEDLRTFETKEEARNFAVDNSNVAAIFDYNRIERITAALEPMVTAAIEKHFELNPREPQKEMPKAKDEELER